MVYSTLHLHRERSPPLSHCSLKNEKKPRAKSSQPSRLKAAVPTLESDECAAPSRTHLVPSPQDGARNRQPISKRTLRLSGNFLSHNRGLRRARLVAILHSGLIDGFGTGLLELRLLSAGRRLSLCISARGLASIGYNTTSW